MRQVNGLGQVRIQARAVRRSGELLKTFDGRGGDRSKSGGVPTSAQTQREAADDAEMSKRQQVTAVRVANVPQAEFQDAVNFDPKETKAKDVKADAVISTAHRLQDWPLLETAVEKKVDEIAEFVHWWKTNVRGKGKKANSADLRYFQADAEKLTGISPVQVSCWCTRLKDIEASQRATAKMLGVDHRTVARDLDGGEFSPPEPSDTAEINNRKDVDGDNSPAWFQDDADPAQLAKDKAKKDEKIRQREGVC